MEVACPFCNFKWLYDGKYDNGIPDDQAGNIISKSIFNDLYNEHNHNIKWSPHTHIGKARGRINLEQTQ